MRLPKDYPRSPREGEKFVGVLSFFVDQDGTHRADIALPSDVPPSHLMQAVLLWVHEVQQGRATEVVR